MFIKWLEHCLNFPIWCVWTLLAVEDLVMWITLLPFLHRRNCINGFSGNSKMDLGWPPLILLPICRFYFVVFAIVFFFCMLCLLCYFFNGDTLFSCFFFLLHPTRFKDISSTLSMYIAYGSLCQLLWMLSCCLMDIILRPLVFEVGQNLDLIS